MPFRIDDPFRARLYRLIFGLAAAYNIGLGLWAVLTPRGFFDLFRLAPPRYPAIWSTLGMVLGLYGLLYAYAALHLDWARPVVAVGLAGKILGPIGWMLAVHAGELPVRTFALIAFDDIVWWLPFALFLLEGTQAGARLRALAPQACAGVNLLAAAALLLVLSPGLTVAALAPRAAYVVDHPLAWRLGWGIWIAAALTLVAFYGWWGARVQNSKVATIAVGIAVAGIACDVSAESLLIGWLPANFEATTRLATVLTGGAANGLYTIAGIVLTTITPFRSARFRAWTWAVWVAGVFLSAFALAGWISGIALSTAILFVLFCPWAYAMRWQLR
ncbi:MAG TPA: hypothetical protein VEQ12_02135 [Candidatus Limnocylindria bacterium]|nr:hypothetical protein [Candidatus Limnocylindria bacterium]